MNVHAKRGQHRGEEGAAAVEFALVSIPLFTLVFGIIAFGFLFAQELSLGNAARQGARYGVVAERTCDAITTETRNAAGTLAMEPADVDVEVATSEGGGNVCTSGTVVPCKDSDPGDSIYVTANFTSDLIVPLPVGDPSFDLDGTGVFRCEFS